MQSCATLSEVRSVLPDLSGETEGGFASLVAAVFMAVRRLGLLRNTHTQRWISATALSASFARLSGISPNAPQIASKSLSSSSAALVPVCPSLLHACCYALSKWHVCVVHEFHFCETGRETGDWNTAQHSACCVHICRWLQAAERTHACGNAAVHLWYRTENMFRTCIIIKTK